MKLSKCTNDELNTLRRAVSQAGSKVRHVILNVEQDEDEGATVYVCAHALEKLSAAMWAKQLGVGRLQQEMVQCTDGVEQAMTEYSSKHGLIQGSEERFGSPSQRQGQAAAAVVAQAKSKSISRKRKESDSEASDEDNEGGPVMMECDNSPPKTASFSTTSVPQVERRGLLEAIMSHQFSAGSEVPPILAWEKFNQQAAFWYVRTGGEYGNEQHMPTVFQAMHEHPQSHGGWHALVGKKRAELATGTRCAGVDQGLLRFLLGKRLDDKMLWKVEEVWGKFEAWAKEHSGGGGQERDTLHTRIQVMGTHAQSDIDWRRHAVKKNRYYVPAMCQ